MRARYYISFNGVDYLEFFPSNTPKVTPQQESGEAFFRYNIDQFIIGATKNPTIYTTLDSYFFDDTKFGTDINFRIQENDVTTFEFIGSINEGDIDTERRVYSISPLPDDEYRAILNQYKTEWQDRGTSGIFGLSGNVYYPKLDTGIFTNVDITSFTDSLGNVTWSDAGGANANARNVLAAASPDDGIVYVNITVFTGDAFILRLVNSGFSLISNQVDVTADGVYALTQTSASGTVYVDMLIDSADPVSGSFAYEIYYPIVKVNSGVTYESLINLILNNASYMNLSYTVVSTFLWNDALGSDPPAGIDTYITSNPTKDYVIEDTAIYNNLIIARTDQWTTTKAPLLKLTFKDLMDHLKTYLRAWWFIDEDGNFRIEHERYIRDYDSQINIPVISPKAETDMFNYQYDKSNIFGTITYRGNNEINSDFIAYPVIYDKVKTNDKNNEINTDVTTDLANVIDNPSDVNNDGLMIIATKKSGTLSIVPVIESPITAGSVVINGQMAWSFLAVNYWKYFGEADEADINNGTTLTLSGVKEFLKQTGISFYSLTALDWKKPVTLAKGTAWLTKWTYTPETGYYSIDVGYDPYNL